MNESINMTFSPLFCWCFRDLKNQLNATEIRSFSSSVPAFSSVSSTTLSSFVFHSLYFWNNGIMCLVAERKSESFLNLHATLLIKGIEVANLRKGIISFWLINHKLFQNGGRFITFFTSMLISPANLTLK